MFGELDPWIKKVTLLVIAGLLAYFFPDKFSIDTVVNLFAGTLIGAAVVPRPGDVKKASIFVLALCFASSTSACGALAGVKVDWPAMVQCGDAAYDVAPAVSRILVEDGFNNLSGENRRELSELALQFGADVVTCAIRRLTEAWRNRGTSQSPELIAAANRGDDFLASVGVTEVHLE